MNKQFISDVLSAGALGDAFGYVVEFDQWEKIQHRFGSEGLQTLQPNPVATDDTQMTLFAIEGIVLAMRENKSPSIYDFYSHARWAFLRWYETQNNVTNPIIPGSIFEKETKLFARRAPGNTCMYALSDYHCGEGTIEIPSNDSKGCGAVMRSAPYGFLVEIMTEDEVWAIAARSGAITHGHVDGWGSGAALAYIIAKMYKGETLESAAKAAASKALEHGCVDTALFIEKALIVAQSDDLLSPEELCDTLGEGWTGEEALSVAIYSALRSLSVYNAILIGANHRGDSDSTASIAGQLAAARFGMNEKERAEFNNVDLSGVVTKACDLLCENF